MSLSAKISSLLGAAAVIGITLLFGVTSNVNADCIYQYNANGFTTSSTPVFNQICGAPEGVGDEANFVRIREDLNGNDEDNVNNPTYNIGTVSSACAAGDKFDVWNYVHNNATQNDNPDVGDGSAVATGTYINMSAPIGTTASTFNFTATVGDTGNLTGTAGPTSTTNMTPAVLDCSGQQVQLSLVPGSVNIYSIPYGAWENLPQDAANLNTNLPIGSTNAGLSSLGSGTMWGCWNYRIVVVYQVQVTPVATPPQTTPPTCNTITANDQADIESVSYSANSANVTGYNLNLYSGSNTSGTPIASSGNIGLSALPYQFSSSDLSAGKSYTVVATVLTSMGNITNTTNCAYGFTTAAATTPPAATPPATPKPVAAAPKTLPNTGPGSVVGIFGGTATAGTGLYYWFTKRRLANK